MSNNNNYCQHVYSLSQDADGKNRVERVHTVQLPPEHGDHKELKPLPIVRPTCDDSFTVLNNNSLQYFTHRHLRLVSCSNLWYMHVIRTCTVGIVIVRNDEFVNFIEVIIVVNRHHSRYVYSAEEGKFLLLRGLDCNIPCSDFHGMHAGLSAEIHRLRRGKLFAVFASVVSVQA